MDKEQAFARFRQSFDYLKDIGILHKQSDLCEPLSIGRSHLSEFYNGKDRYFTEGNLRKFAAAYSDYINEEWLLTGEGEMRIPDKSMRPHVEAKAVAGFLDGVSSGEYGELRERMPGIPEYDFTINAEGNSMEPKIESGDVLACRWITDRLNPPIGKICVVDSKDGAVVKMIKSASDDSIMLHSLNARYKDYAVAVADISHIAEVVGLTRAF